MSAYSHTFHYDDDADLIRQLDAMLTKLLGGEGAMEPYAQVRERYPHLRPTAFCTRLKRFTGEFPHELGDSGKRIVRLFVTRELDAYLRKEARPQRNPSLRMSYRDLRASVNRTNDE